MFILNPGKYIKKVKYRERNWRTEPVRKEGSRGWSWRTALEKNVVGRGTDLSSSDGPNFLQRSGEQLRKREDGAPV